MSRKICIFTGTRAEYGLLYWLMKEIEADPELELQIIASGAHCSPEFGLTYKTIEQDGFHINEKVEMLLSSDTSVGISKSTGLGIISYAEALDRLKPDIMVGLGDRFELMAAVTAAMISRIPIGHISGGDTTEGAIDESIRHSITKMSHLHFSTTETYRKRVIQLGEDPKRVFNFGALSIDNIKRFPLLNREEFEQKLGFKLGKRTLLVTFHPVTLEDSTSESQFRQLLQVMDELEDTHIIITKPNADTDGRVLIKMIDDYVLKNSHKAMSSVNLGQLLYLSACQWVDCVVGNSSSGVVEVPSFKKPTLNIGDRQKGRLQAPSIVNCEPDYNSIKEGFNKIFSADFQKSLPDSKNPYEGDGTAIKIKEKLKNYPLEGIIKKSFYNIAFEA